MKKKKVKIAFLDRDGVINKVKIKKEYIGFKKDFKWIPGAKKTIKAIKKLGYKVVVVTNQSGVARGYFSYNDVVSLHKHIQSELKKNFTKIDKYLFCPFHVDGIVKKYSKISKLRKPNNGMFLNIAKIWNIDKKNSFMIGDRNVDMLFAKKSGIKGYLFQEKNLYSFCKKKLFSNLSKHII